MPSLRASHLKPYQTAAFHAWQEVLDEVYKIRNKQYLERRSRGANHALKLHNRITANQFQDLRRGLKFLYPITLEQIAEDIGLQKEDALYTRIMTNGRAYILAMLPLWPDEVKSSVIKQGWSIPEPPSEESILPPSDPMLPAIAPDALKKPSLREYIVGIAQDCRFTHPSTGTLRCLRKEQWEVVPVKQRQGLILLDSLLNLSVYYHKGSPQALSQRLSGLLKRPQVVDLQDDNGLGYLFDAMHFTVEERAKAQEIYIAERALKRAIG